MTPADLASKLSNLALGQDAVHAELVQITRRMDSVELACNAVVQVIRGDLASVLNTQTEMLRKLMELATAEPPGGGHLAESVERLAGATETLAENSQHIRTTLDALPELVEAAVRNAGAAAP